MCYKCAILMCYTLEDFTTCGGFLKIFERIYWAVLVSGQKGWAEGEGIFARGRGECLTMASFYQHEDFRQAL